MLVTGASSGIGAACAGAFAAEGARVLVHFNPGEVERTGTGSLVLVRSTAGSFGEAGHAD